MITPAKSSLSSDVMFLNSGLTKTLMRKFPPCFQPFPDDAHHGLVEVHHVRMVDFPYARKVRG